MSDIKLEVGKSYRSASGRKVYIESADGVSDYVFYGRFQLDDGPRRLSIGWFFKTDGTSLYPSDCGNLICVAEDPLSREELTNEITKVIEGTIGSHTAAEEIVSLLERFGHARF